MSLDFRERVLRDAIDLGVPCVVRVGSVVALCTAVRRRLDGLHEGDCKAWTFPSSAKARAFVERAVHDPDGPRWKCAQRVEPPKSIIGPGSDTRGAKPDHPEARDWPGDESNYEAFGQLADKPRQEAS